MIGNYHVVISGIDNIRKPVVHRPNIIPNGWYEASPTIKPKAAILLAIKCW